jgi:uncharacterized protein YqeY
MESTLRQRLETDLRSAMRAGNTTERDTLRYLLAAIKNAEIDRRGEMTPQDEEAVLRKQAKQLTEAVEQFRAGNREDLAAREEAQLAVLSRYLPAPLSDEELAALVAEVIAETGASDVKDLGKVMPRLIERAGGRADGRRLSMAARQVLTAS